MIRSLIRILLFTSLSAALVGAIAYHVRATGSFWAFEDQPTPPSPDPYALYAYTELMIAADQGDLDTAQRAIANGADVNVRSLDGRTALDLAVKHDHRAIVQLLLNSAIEISAEDRRFLMHSAIRQGNADLVRWCLQHGITVETLTPHYYPLRYAVWANQAEIVQLLLDAGADPNRGDDDAHPILLSALLNESEGVGTSVISELNKSLISPERAAVAILLINAGADPNARSTMNSTTVLTAAAAKAPLDVVDLLIQKGANVNTPGAYNETPLMFAAARNDPAIIQRLLAAGANPNAVQVRVNGKTALIYAVETNGIKGAIALLEGGASVNAVTSRSVGAPGPLVSRSMTALDLAEYLGYTELAHQLRQYGAKPYSAME